MGVQPLSDGLRVLSKPAVGGDDLAVVGSRLYQTHLFGLASTRVIASTGACDPALRGFAVCGLPPHFNAEDAEDAEKGSLGTIDDRVLRLGRGFPADGRLAAGGSRSASAF